MLHSFRKISILGLVFISSAIFATVSAQVDAALTWKTLGKISFKEQFNPETSDVVYAPIYSKYVKELEGKEIILRGYLLPVASRNGTVILSAFPFSSCYFCGGAGPETVIEVHPKVPIINRSGKPVSIKGRLKLNQPYDSLLLPYFLMDAQLHVEE